MTLKRSVNKIMPFALHECFKFKGVECSYPEYSIFSKGSKFIQKNVITQAKILDIKKTAESFTYRNFQTNYLKYESRVILSVFF
ncbi:uncharacterized protein METZ01_LOCUS463389 [marine metagenome]|uniref:Uncharacterized protein n=1 Tax=marine metagenome TaxID=408172 RepID=A0A383ATL6_9ZZZZ